MTLNIFQCHLKYVLTADCFKSMLLCFNPIKEIYTVNTISFRLVDKQEAGR